MPAPDAIALLAAGAAPALPADIAARGDAMGVAHRG